MLNCESDSSGGTWGCFKVQETHWGYISSFLCLGALFGCLLGGRLVDRLGRRGVILWNNVAYLLGLGLMLGSMHWVMLLMGRLLVGIGVGVSCVAVPMYLTEVSSWDVRGLIGSLHQLMIVLGNLLALVLGLTPLLSKSFGYGWRIVLGADVLVCAMQLVLALGGVFRESPKYHVLQGRKERAEETLRWLRGSKYDAKELESTDGTSDVQPLSLYTLLRTRFSQIWKSLGLVLLLHIGQQVSGVNAIFYFSALMFQDNAYVPVLIAVFNVVMTVVSLVLMDRAGRRPLLLSSLVGMILCYLLFTLSMYQTQITGLKAISVLGFIASFALGMGPVPWLMLGEVFSPWSVSAGVSLGVSANWISNFIIVALFQTQLRTLGRNVMVPYLFFLILILLWALKYLPETKGRSAGLI